MKNFIIKNSYKEMFLLKKRIVAVSVIIVILSILLIIRLFNLQVIQHKYYTTLSKLNSIELLPIEPRRGLIYDRNGVLIAKNIPVFSLMVTPSHVKNINKTIAAINKIIPITKNDLEQFDKQTKQHRRFEQIPLKLKLTDTQIAKFAVNRFRFPGVTIKAKLIREYPYGKALASVLGFVGRINAQDLEQVSLTNYAATNFIGKVGIEKYYEKQLHGTVGYRKVETDASGEIIRNIKTIPAIRGNNLYLTIDSGLQIAAKKALGKLNGAVVAIKPSTGEILTLASNPSYDPNKFVDGISQQDFIKLQQNKNHPLFNRTIRGLYPSGSTIKPFIGLEGLNSGAITPTYKIFDPGWFQIPNTKHIFHDWKRDGHGWVNLTKAIIESCDTYFYNLAYKMGIARIDDILNQFYFGKLTGVDLGEELPGNIPSPDWKIRYVGLPWYSGDTINAGIGQGYIQVTPLQLANATAILANRGQRFQPHLLYATELPSAQIIKKQPKEEDPIILKKQKYWKEIIYAMSKVVTGLTGFRFGRSFPYTVAAKTGTAQLVSLQYAQFHEVASIPKNLRDNSVFIVFAPIDKPKIAVAVVAENSTHAPIIARKVLDYYLLHEKKLYANTTQTKTTV